MNNYKITMSEKQYNDYLQYLTTAPNIQDVKKPNKKEFGEENKHPTIKPVKLMEWLIKLTTNEGDIVLDPFTGSGTTLVAASNLKRIAVGIEMQPEYIATIKNRAPTAIIKLGDCIDVMKKMDANSVDAIITDPPYAIAMADWDKFKTMKHFQQWCNDWGKEAFRILRPGGIIASFNAARTYHFMAMGLEDAGFQCRDMVEWVYWSGMPKGKNLKSCHEPIYMGWKPEKSLENFTFNIDACRIPVKEKTSKAGITTVSINNLEMQVERE
jgi:DNA modification methylase